MALSVSIVVATCGSPEWSDLAWSRAYPSTMDQLGDYDVQILHLPEGTVAQARNTAAADSGSDWLCFLDADDELAEGYLDAMRDAMDYANLCRPGDLRANPRLLVPAVSYVGEDGSATPAKIPNRGGWPRVNECVIGTLVPRLLFLEVGGFRDDLASLEDYELWLRCFRAGGRLRYVEDAVYRAFIRPGGRNLDQSAYPTIWAEHEAAA